MARHLRRIRWAPGGLEAPDLAAWPFTIPAVAELIAKGAWEVPDGVTFLVGENGSGKSTIVEALAAGYSRRGHAGAEENVVGPAESVEDSPLRWHLWLDTDPMASPAGFVLRAELMHGYLAGVSPPRGTTTGYNERSHGESFLALIRDRFADIGFYLLDEPEAALSFTAQLGLLGLLGDMVAEGSQVVVATHSPLLIALPGATIWELGEWGRREVAYADCDLVRQWRAFLDAPERFTRHL